jgi:ATP-dependent protease ClpP protease subunit
MRLSTILVSFLVACSAPTKAQITDSATAAKVESAVSIPVIEFDENSLSAVYSKIKELVSTNKSITLRIDSYGGSIFDGQDFISKVTALKRAEQFTVTCISTTRAISMGFVLLQSPVCDTRLMTKSAILLAHNGSTRTAGTVEQIQEDAELLKALNEAMAEMICARIKLSVEEYKAKIALKAWTMSWAEAVEVGAVDGTIELTAVPPDVEIAKAMTLGDLLGF